MCKSKFEKERKKKKEIRLRVSELVCNFIYLAKAENTGSATVLVLAAAENKQRCLMALLALCRHIGSSVCRGLSLHRYLIGDRHAK